jgi:hypothetical protein
MKLGYLIAFVAGGAIGTSLTFCLSKRHFEKRKAIELEAYKEYYDKRLGKTEKPEEKCEEAEPGFTDGDASKVVNSYLPEATDVIAHDDNSAEAKEIREAANYLEKIGIEQEEKVSKKRGKTKKEKPYLITPEAFTGDDDTMYKDNYQHLTLEYYEGDDMVCESTTNEVFANTGRWLGYTWKNHFGDEDYDYGPNEVFIRNDEIGVDYEIVRDPGYYSEIVLGLYQDKDEEE